MAITIEAFGKLLKMNLADKTILNVIARSSGALLLLISSIFWVRNFTKTEYGTFLQIMLIANTANMLMSLGIPQSIFYFFQRTVNQRHFIIKNVMLFLFIGLTASALVFGIKNQLAHWLNNPNISIYGWVASLLILLRAPSFMREPILLSSDNLVPNAFATVVCNLTLYIPVIVCILMEVSFRVLLTIFVISNSIEFCVNIGFITRAYSHINNSSFCPFLNDERKTKISLKEQLNYALPIGFSSYLGVIGQQLDKYLVSTFFLPSYFAIYARGAMKIPVLSSLSYTVNNVLMHKYVVAYRDGDIKGLIKYFHLSIEKVAKINLPMFFLLFALSPALITLLYTKEYLDASNIFRIYLFSIVISITAAGTIPNVTGKTLSIFYSNVIFVCSNFLISLLLLYMLGPIGAALGTLVSGFLTCIYLILRSCKILGISVKNIFPWICLVKLLLASSIASVPVYLVNFIYQPEGVNMFFLLMAEGFMYLSCYVYFLVKKDLLYPDDIALLTKWLRFDVNCLLKKRVFL